jgi:integrase
VHTIPLLMLTGLHQSGEALGLRWKQVDLFGRTITVGRATTFSGTGRVIPLRPAFSSHLADGRAKNEINRRLSSVPRS